MDTDVVKTFLEVASAGSFGHAAARLNIAQTTVSARIRKLEDTLGKQLLVRSKAGAKLTRSGEQFLRLAPAFVQLGERMLSDLSVPEGCAFSLSLGGEVSLASTWMPPWISLLRREMADTALRIKIDIPADLINRFSEGSIDAALMHAPPERDGLRSDLVAEERLLLVTTDPAIRSVTDPRFVYVDWGETFTASFRSSYPEFQGTPLSFDHGLLAFDYVLANGGAVYVKLNSARAALETGRIRIVEEAVKFSHPVYIIRPADIANPALDKAAGLLREVCKWHNLHLPEPIGNFLPADAKARSYAAHKT